MNSQEAKIISEFLLKTLEFEIPTTVGVFRAVPSGNLDYRPDQTSKHALALMRHIALEDEWFLNSIADGAFAPPPDDSDSCGVMSPSDAAERYQERIPVAIDRVRSLSGEALTRQLDLMGAFQLPALQFLSLMLRHSTHHRGQLTAYLRAMGGKVPSIYGPSADTVPAGATAQQLTP